jgi:hypothetical protein
VGFGGIKQLRLLCHGAFFGHLRCIHVEFPFAVFISFVLIPGRTLNSENSAQKGQLNFWQWILRRQPALLNEPALLTK